jgi:hypothetical protein
VRADLPDDLSVVDPVAGQGIRKLLEDFQDAATHNIELAVTRVDETGLASVVKDYRQRAFRALYRAHREHG